MKKLISLVLAVFITSVVSAEQCKKTKEYYKDSSRGYYYFEDCSQEEVEIEKEKEPEIPKLQGFKTIPKEQQIPWDILDEIDPSEIDAIHLQALSVATMHPTEENVKEHKKLLMWITQKAMSYVVTNTAVTKTDADLAKWAGKNPASTSGRHVKIAYMEKKKKEIIYSFKDKAGLIVLTQQGCIYCEKQKEVLNILRGEMEWVAKTVDARSVPNMAAKFGVSTFPDIFLVINRGGQPVYQRIGAGFHTYASLKDGILFGLKYLGEIDETPGGYI